MYRTTIVYEIYSGTPLDVKQELSSLIYGCEDGSLYGRLITRNESIIDDEEYKILLEEM